MAVTAAWRNSEYLADLMARHRCPGLSICEIRDFAIACQVNAGVRSAVSADRVDCYTLFQAGSISKLVFALAVMRLVQDGVLNLDADVNNYLQSCQLTAGPGVATGATLRQILSHTAGVTVRGFPGYRLDEPIPDLLQVIEGSAPANTEPIYIATPSGRQFQYSGGGTTVAQQLVMDVTQRPFPDLMRSLVLEPAGMAHSGYLQPLPHSLRAAAASGHLEDGTPVPDGYFVYPELAAAGLWSTAGDLAALGMTVMQTLRGKETGLGLTPATLASMFEPPPHSQCANNGYLGLGWFCAGAAETLCVSHAGENEGFISHLVLMPAKGAGIAIMANSLAGWPLIDHLVDAAGFNPASI